MQYPKALFMINSRERPVLVKRRDVLRFFEANGFVIKGGTNHDKLVHPDGRRTYLGRHAEIDNKLFEKMKKEAGLR